MEILHCSPYSKILSSYFSRQVQTIISLLSILSKVLERHLHTLIMDHLHCFHSLDNNQWGFQPGKSTIAVLIETTDSWFHILEQGTEVATVFFDLRKAFDTVPHICLIRKPGYWQSHPALDTDYLTNRQQRIVVNEKISQFSHVLSACGVPQGSVLVFYTLPHLC